MRATVPKTLTLVLILLLAGGGLLWWRVQDNRPARDAQRQAAADLKSLQAQVRASSAEASRKDPMLADLDEQLKALDAGVVEQAAAAAGHLGGIDAFLGQQFGSGRHGDAAGGATGGGRCGGLGRGSGGGCLGGSSGLRRGRAGGGFGVDDGDQLIGHDRGAVPLLDVGDHAGRRRGQFQHHLVGLDVDQVLVTGDSVADFLVPLQQRGLGHRLGQLRHLDFNLSHFGKTPGSFWEWGYGGTPRVRQQPAPGVPVRWEDQCLSLTPLVRPAPPKALSSSSFCWAKCLS